MRIARLGVYLPETIVTTSAVVEGCANKVRIPLERLTGIKQRRVVGPGEFSVDLAKRAIEKCEVDPAEIDAIICCNISRYDAPDLSFSAEPSTAAKLKTHFGFTRALAFDVSNACAGMFTGIFVASKLFDACRVKKALVVSGEYISHLIAAAQREIEGVMDPRLACLTLGDAGAAVLLDGEPGFVDLDMYTLGKHAELCVGGPASDGKSAIMLTDAVALSAAALEQAVMHAAIMLQHNAWEPETIRQLIQHQTSKTTLSDAERQINAFYKKRVISPANNVNNLAERGNTATTTHMVALADLTQKAPLMPDDRIVFSITGSGLTVGTALYSPTHRRAAAAPTPPRVKIEAIGGARKAETSLALAEEAVNQCLAPGTRAVDTMIYAGVHRSDFVHEPAFAARLQGRMDINSNVGWDAQQRTFAFDLLAGPAGFLTACFIAQHFVKQRALVIAGDVEPNKAAPFAGIANAAGAVTLVPSTDATGFERFFFRDYAEDVEHSFYQGHALHVSRAPNADARYIARISEALAAEGIVASDYDHVFLPQLSSQFVSTCAAALATTKAIDVTAGADLHSASLPLALLAARPALGTRALFVAMSPGIQISGATYHF